MKICFVAPKSYALFSGKQYEKGMFGGSEVQLYLIANELIKNSKYSVQFLTADYGQNETEIYNKIEVIKSFSYNQNPIFVAYKLIFSLFKSNSDIYIQRALSPMSGIIALICKIKRKKFIYWVASDVETDQRIFEKMPLFTRFTSKLAFRLADTVIVQNKYQYESFLTNFQKHPKLIRNGFTFENPEIEKDGTILWVGRCEKLKKPELFIELASQLNETRFVMVCPSAMNQEKYFQEIKLKSSTIPNLEFKDFVEFNEIETYFRRSVVFVNTSEFEGFPNTFIQAAKYKNVIVSLNVDPDNFIRNFKCGKVCNGEEQKIKENIVILLNAKNLMNELAENAFTYAKENHNIAKNTQQLIKEVLQKFEK